jgi:superoxide dismutase, Cu-Zn family
MRRLAAFVLAVLVTACASAGRPTAPFVAAPTRSAWIIAADGRSIGEAKFFNARDGILIRLEFSEAVLPQGWHGAHLHEHGDCGDFAAGFQAAGAHVGRANHVRHGLRSDMGPEAGDLPNIFAASAAPYAAELLAPHVTLPTLLDEDGAALIIHANPDDQQSQPIGGAGPRVACAALRLIP